MHELVEAWQVHIPLLGELSKTPQDPRWHAEGDVLVHTEMVLQETYRALDGAACDLDPLQRCALVLGAALHDIAKPLTTGPKEIRGVQRIAAPRHEARGRSCLVPMLCGQGLPYPLVETVLGLVGYHVHPKFLVIKDRPAGDYHRLSRHANPELLYWLELADMRGRTCEDKAQQLEYIELFGMFARDYGAWRRFGDSATQWLEVLREGLHDHSEDLLDLAVARSLTDHEAGTISTPHEGIARSYAARDGFGQVVVTVGPSGSGKSTWVAAHLGDHHVISLDAIRAELGSRHNQRNNTAVVHIARDRLRAHLRRNERVVWDATSLRSEFRAGILGLAGDYGALTTIVAFAHSTAAYARGNAQREFAVPAKVLHNQLASMQWPELTEAHRTLTIGEHGEVLACYGCHAAQLPYGLGDRAHVPMC